MNSDGGGTEGGEGLAFRLGDPTRLRDELSDYSHARRQPWTLGWGPNCLLGLDATPGH